MVGASDAIQKWCYHYLQHNMPSATVWVGICTSLWSCWFWCNQVSIWIFLFELLLSSVKWIFFHTQKIEYFVISFMEFLSELLSYSQLFYIVLLVLCLYKRAFHWVHIIIIYRNIYFSIIFTDIVLSTFLTDCLVYSQPIRVFMW